MLGAVTAPDDAYADGRTYAVTAANAGPYSVAAANAGTYAFLYRYQLVGRYCPINSRVEESIPPENDTNVDRLHRRITHTCYQIADAKLALVLALGEAQGESWFSSIASAPYAVRQRAKFGSCLAGQNLRSCL